MICYSAVEMMLLNEKWIEEHGDHWATGRIEVYGCEPYGFEYPVSPMHEEDWNALADWTEKLQTEELWELDKIIEAFEEYNGQFIRWCYV